jgi:hypothetical protein
MCSKLHCRNLLNKMSVYMKSCTTRGTNHSHQPTTRTVLIGSRNRFYLRFAWGLEPFGFQSVHLNDLFCTRNRLDGRTSEINYITRRDEFNGRGAFLETNQQRVRFNGSHQQPVAAYTGSGYWSNFQANPGDLLVSPEDPGTTRND